MVRPPCCEKMGVKKGPWTPEEDYILVTYVQRYGHDNWRALPKQAGLLRCGKSCRLRWINYLRPDIKRGNFSKEEEETIIKLHEMMGNRWSAIATQLPGRTDNEIKNYWNTHLKKRVEQTLMIRNTWKRNVTRLEQRTYDSSDSDPEGSSPNHHLAFQNAADRKKNSPETISNTLVRSECCNTHVTKIQEEKSYQISAASNFQAAENSRLHQFNPGGDHGGSDMISNDMFFWYNVFVNAGKT